MPLDETTARLYATTNASVWAAEWCRIAREIEAADDDRQVIDDGWMIGWFANAMCVAIDHERKRIAEQIVGYPITIDVDRLGQDDHAAD